MQGNQGRLFDQLPLPEEVTRLVRIAGSAKTLSPAQRTFNRLSQELDGLEKSVALWNDRIQRLGQRMRAEMLSRLEALKET